MPGLSFSLPIYTDDVDGFKLNKTYLDLAQQNLKCLILTNPGEKIMHPTFGVGIKRYLFEPMTSDTHQKISSKIHEQAEEWLPYIEILNLEIIEPHSPSGRARGMTSANEIAVKITFEVTVLGQIDQLKLYFKP